MTKNNRALKAATLSVTTSAAKSTKAVLTGSTKAVLAGLTDKLPWDQLDATQLNERLAFLPPEASQKMVALLLPQCRERARQSLAEFVRQAWHVMEPCKPLIWNWHVEHICQHLQAITEGKIRRLVINIPPGHSKSLLTAVFWPAWVWLQQPEWRMLCGAYGMDLAIRDAVRCRELIESDWYQKMFAPDWRLTKAQNAKRHFRNTQRGERVAVSVGGRVTGFRGDCVLIDDPLNAMDAYSSLKRRNAINWFDQAASNRLNDLRYGAIVLIMQRLHHEDLSGHILRQGGYEHLCLPTRFEPERPYATSIGWSDPRREKDELLFAEMFPEAEIDREEKRMGLLGFAGQHQQNPTPAAGNLFKAEMLCPDARGKSFWPFPEGAIPQAYFGWDTANKTKTSNDYTAGCLTMMAADGYVYLLPITLARLEVPQVVKTIMVQWAHWRKRLDYLQGCRIEEGAGTAPVQYMQGLLAQMERAETPSPLWTPQEWHEVRQAPPILLLPFTPNRDKMSRAAAVLPFVASHNVRLVDSSLSRDWLEQLLAFDLGTHDDAVDATVTALEPFACRTDDQVKMEDLLKSLQRNE